MRIVSNVLENIINAQWYAIVGLLIFFVFFSILIIRVVRMNKTEVEAISRMPLEEDDDTSFNT
jgi:hypothetical protein